jgi:hypothetical protein
MKQGRTTLATPLAAFLVATAGAACDGESTKDAGTTGSGATAGTGGSRPVNEDGGSGAGEPAAGAPSAARSGDYVLGSVVIDADGNRTTYVQVIQSLDAGPFDNQSAVELTGNGVILAQGRSFYVGHTEDPTWSKYTVEVGGAIQRGPSMSLLATGASSIDYGNAIVDAETAVSVLSKPPLAVVWNPKTMEITGEIELEGLARAGYELEVWTTVAYRGLVYVPGRWSDWDGGRIYPSVSTTIIDPKAMKVLGTAEDDRCASGGRVVFDEKGYAYVLGDGRTYSLQMFANAAGKPAPQNCLLRIAPGKTDFDEDYYYTIPSLTGGIDAIDELDTARQGSGVGFSKMFYPDELPPGVEPVDFDFWNVPAHKLWRIELTDPPTAKEVEGIPFSTIGFGGSALDDHLYSGESPDGKASDVYETSPVTNRARLRFSMDGYFYGLYRLDEE